MIVVALAIAQLILGYEVSASEPIADREAKMCEKFDYDDYRGVARIQRSPLGNLATWFHQDWAMENVDFLQSARDYIRELSSDEREALRAELLDFLASLEGKNSEQARGEWRALGAETIPSDIEVVELLRQILNSM